MKKIIQRGCVFLLFFLVIGCSNQKKNEQTQSSENEASKNNIVNKDEDMKKQKETSQAWDLLDNAFEKLKTVSIVGSGLHTEVAHINFGSTEGLQDKTKIYASYEQSKVDFNIQDTSNAQFNIAGYIGFINGDVVEDLFGDSSEVFNLENLLKNHVLTTDSISTYTVDAGILSSNNQIQENTESEYFNYLNLFKKSEQFPTFLNRGKSDVRLLSDSYFTGSIQENELGSLLLFTFDEASLDYQNIINTFYQEYGVGTAYEVTDAYVECDKEEIGAKEFTKLGVDNDTVIYMKPGLKEEFKSAQICVQLDKEGYPISYVRESVFRYAQQEAEVIYSISYTFTRE